MSPRDKFHRVAREKNVRKEKYSAKKKREEMIGQTHRGNRVNFLRDRDLVSREIEFKVTGRDRR